MSSTELPATFGFVGNAKASLELVAAELDNFLPRKIDGLILPDKITRKQEGLENVLGWLTKEVGDDDIITAADVVDELKVAKGEGETVALIVLWGEGDDDTYKIVEAAIEAGIPALDLTQGMESIEITDEDSPADAKQAPDEAEAAAEAPKRRSRRTRRDESAEDVSEPPKGKRQSRTKAEQTTIDEAIAKANEEHPDPDDVPFVPINPPHSDLPVIPLSPGTSTETAQQVAGLSTEALAAFVDARVSVLFHDFAKYLAERAASKTYTLILDADGGYHKKGRGRPRAGSTEVQLTIEQVREHGLEDLVTGNA